MIFTLTTVSCRRAAIRCASFALLLTAFAGVVAGCSKSESGDDGAGSQASFDSTSMKGSDVVATVNSETITASDLFDGMAHYVPAGLPGFPNNLQLHVDAGHVVLQNLIIDKLKLQMAAAYKVPVEQADIDKSYNDYQLVEQNQTSLPYETFLSQQGYTPDQFKKEVLAPQVAELNLLQSHVVLSDEALQQFYKSTQSNYHVPAAVHAHRIICATENQAENVAKGIKAGHPISDFLADNIAANGAGGDLSDDSNFADWINTDRPSPQLGKAGPALAAAKTGDVVGPYQIGNAWWVFQVQEKRPSQLMPYDKVQDLVRINYIHQMAGAQGNEALQLGVLQQIRSAVIHINIPALQNLAVQMHDINIPNPQGAPPPPQSAQPTVPAPAKK